MGGKHNIIPCSQAINLKGHFYDGFFFRINKINLCQKDIVENHSKILV